MSMFYHLRIHGATQSWHRISIQYDTSRKTGTTETKRKHPPGWSSQCLTVPLAGIVFNKYPLESNQLRNKPSIQWPSCSWNRCQWHTNMGNNKIKTQWMSQCHNYCKGMSRSISHVRNKREVQIWGNPSKEHWPCTHFQRSTPRPWKDKGNTSHATTHWPEMCWVIVRYSELLCQACPKRVNYYYTNPRCFEERFFSLELSTEKYICQNQGHTFLSTITCLP